MVAGSSPAGGVCLCKRATRGVTNCQSGPPHNRFSKWRPCYAKKPEKGAWISGIIRCPRMGYGKRQPSLFFLFFSLLFLPPPISNLSISLRDINPICRLWRHPKKSRTQKWTRNGQILRTFPTHIYSEGRKNGRKTVARFRRTLGGDLRSP